MAEATVTSKGQITIPKRVREHLGVRPGDKLDFVVEEDGQVVVRPISRDIRDLAGVLHRPGACVVTLEEMDRAIRERTRRS